jgi:hypothetical protein
VYEFPTERCGRLVAVPGLQADRQWSHLPTLAPASDKRNLATIPKRLLSS